MKDDIKQLEAMMKYIHLIMEGKRTVEQFDEFFYKPKTIDVNYSKTITYKCNLK